MRKMIWEGTVGDIHTRLYLDDANVGGIGSYRLPSDKEKRAHAIIRLGIDANTSYAEVWSTLLHELFEMVADDRQGSFYPARTATGSSDGKQFVFKHPLFCEIIDSAAMAMCQCGKPLRQGHRDYVQSQRTKGKRKKRRK